jgi:hypothetical protein
LSVFGDGDEGVSTSWSLFGVFRLIVASGTLQFPHTI